MTRASEAKVEILADPEALSRRVAVWLLELAIAKGRHFCRLPVRRLDPATVL